MKQTRGRMSLPECRHTHQRHISLHPAFPQATANSTHRTMVTRLLHFPPVSLHLRATCQISIDRHQCLAIHRLQTLGMKASMADRLHSMVHHSSLIISNRNMSNIPNAVHRLPLSWPTSSTVGDRRKKKILPLMSMIYLSTHPSPSLLYLQRCTMNFLLALWHH